MLWTGKGKVVVASAGTPVQLSTVKVAVNTILVTYDSTDGSVTIYVKDGNGNVIASMATAASAQPILFTAPGSNQLDLRNFWIDSSVSGKGPYVGYGVD